jgi:hypothetical protein
VVQPFELGRQGIAVSILNSYACQMVVGLERSLPELSAMHQV